VQLLGFQTRRERSELRVGLGDRLTKPGDLGGHQLPRNLSIDDRDARREQTGLPYCDSVRCGYAF
jgi:hypothetical protein